MEVTRKVQVDILHGHHLSVAAASSTALNTEARAQRRFAQRDHGLLANAVQRIAQTNGGRGLALARRGRVDRGHQDHLAVGLVFHRVNVVELDLRLVVAIGLDHVFWNAELVCNLDDLFHLCTACNIDVTHGLESVLTGLAWRRCNAPAGINCRAQPTVAKKT